MSYRQKKEGLDACVHIFSTYLILLKKYFQNEEGDFELERTVKVLLQ